MKFGLPFQLPQSPHQSDVALYRDSLDQAAHAETLGFESVWPVEQHFNAAFSLLPSPLLWLAALAAGSGWQQSSSCSCLSEATDAEEIKGCFIEGHRRGCQCHKGSSS